MDIIDWQKEYRADGIFWLPATPKSRTFGTLTARAGYWPLLNVFHGLLPQGVVQAAVVHGEVGGHPVSLLSCGNYSGTETRQVIGCEAILHGLHIKSDIIGRTFVLRYTNLHPLLSTKLWLRDPDKDVVRYDFSIDRRVAQIANSTLTIEIDIEASPEIKWTASGPPSFNVSPNVSVTVHAADPLALSGIKDLATDLGLLWSLLNGELSDLTGVSALSVTATTEVQGQIDRSRACDMIWNCDRIAGDVNCSGSVLRSLRDGDYAGRLADIIVAWLSKRDRLRIATRLLVDSWKPGVSREAQLGALAQSLEALHRASSHQQVFTTKDDYANIEKSLVQSIGQCVANQDLKTALRKRVEYGNQVSLRRRTRDLFRSMPPTLRDAFGPWKPLVDWMTDVRNQVIHREPDIPPMPHRELVRVTGLLGLIIHTSILQEIGVPDKILTAERILIQSRYQTLIRYWNMS